MILRKAKLEDFEVFKKLFEDKEDIYHFLLKNPENKDTITLSECNWTFDDDIFEVFENYTIEHFQNDLKMKLVYMIEDSSEVIGHITLSYSGSYKYKITEWTMFNPENEQKKLEVLNCLKKLKIPYLRKFSISTINEDVGKFLLSNGFTYWGCFFYQLEI